MSLSKVLKFSKSREIKRTSPGSLPGLFLDLTLGISDRLTVSSKVYNYFFGGFGLPGLSFLVIDLPHN
jgi:hypothetical protein